MLRAHLPARQTAINSICSHFVFFQVRSTYDLSANLEKLIKKINQDPKIFIPTDTLLQRREIFESAIAAYARMTDYNIKIPANMDWGLFITEREEIIEQATEDLLKVTRSYDQFLDAIQINKKTSQIITALLKHSDISVCDSIILGAGDTGTALWLEKYKSQHGATYHTLSDGQFPNVLIISDGFGSWKHDYTLAQTHSSLERSCADQNPSDFLPAAFYEKNPPANARHIFQANQVCLAKTQAPLLMANLLRIEKKENHSDWQISQHPYRLIIQFPTGDTKAIYTQSIEICTGLGAANVTFDPNVISQQEANRLTQFNSRLGFTPIIDGNQFMLTNSEEGKNNRTIVIYGGGGTSSACYRKSFFGNDIRSYDRSFISDNQKNKVIWVFRDFIGTGKLSTTAVSAAKKRNEVFQGVLMKIEPQSDEKLVLSFKMHNSDGSFVLQDFLCDQLVYSIGQDDARMRQVCNEIKDNLQLCPDKSGMLLYISTPDKKIRFFGAAATIFYKSEFLKLLTKWLDAQNIGGDVGPGSMPVTRAQLKQHLALNGVKPESINVNMDNSYLIGEFLLDAQIDKTAVAAFIDDLLLARKHNTYGCSRVTLEQLLKKYQLDKVFDIFGHSHLILKGKTSLASSKYLTNFSFLTTQKINLPVTEDDTKLQSSGVYFRRHAGKI